jgi:hypothetical protein
LGSSLQSKVKSMADEYLQRAKEIFFNYSCNHFFLDRDVDANEYRRYDISNEQEKKWTREYTEYWIGKLSVDDFQAVNRLNAASAGEALPEMSRISELGDSFTKLWYANAIWDIACSGIMSPIMRERARRKSIYLWQSLLKGPIEFTADHRNKVSAIVENRVQVENSIRTARESQKLHQHPTTSQTRTPEEYILDYAKSKLRESKKRNGFYFLVVSLLMGFMSVASMLMDWVDKIKRLGKR